MDTSKVVMLMRFNQLGRAEIMQGLFESNGIEYSLVGETIQSVLPSITGGGSPIQLMVAEKDMERARKVLAAKFDVDEFEAETGTKPRKKTCASKSCKNKE